MSVSKLEPNLTVLAWGGGCIFGRVADRIYYVKQLFDFKLARSHKKKEDPVLMPSSSTNNWYGDPVVDEDGDDAFGHSNLFYLLNCLNEDGV